MNDEIKYQFKKVNVRTAFTENGRKKNLEKLKDKMAKDNWIFDSNIDGGMTKTSTAIFKRDIKYSDGKENMSKGAKFALFLLVLVILSLFFGKNKNNTNSINEEKAVRETNELTNQQTLAEIIKAPKGTIKKIAFAFAKDNNMSEDYYNTMYDCLADNTYTKSKNFTVGKILDWCKNDYTDPIKGKKYIYFNKDFLLEDFSPWDGSYRPLERLIKDSMNDPSSYDHIKTRYRFEFYGKKLARPYMEVTIKYRGKNSYGAIVKGTITAKIDAKTKEMFNIK